MSFESGVMLVCDYFLSQRTFDLIVAPALADLEFEAGTGRGSAIASRAAVIRAVTGAIAEELLRGSSGFFKLSLLSVSYFMFPLAMIVRMFESWSDFFAAASVVLVLAMIPVLVCFWPARLPVRPEH